MNDKLIKKNIKACHMVIQNLKCMASVKLKYTDCKIQNVTVDDILGMLRKHLKFSSLK